MSVLSGWEVRRRDFYLRRGVWEYSIRRSDDHWSLWRRREGDTGWSLLGDFATPEQAEAAI